MHLCIIGSITGFDLAKTNEQIARAIGCNRKERTNLINFKLPTKV
jgi:hypothetical protein